MSQTQSHGRPLRTRPFNHVSSVGDGLPTTTDRHLARRFHRMPRIRKLTWLTHGRRMKLRAEFGCGFDPVLVSDIEDIVEENAPPTYEVIKEDGEVYVENTLRTR